MRSVNYKPALIKSALAASVLLLASTASFGQQTVNLIAGPSTATMADGNTVPMWGLSCAGVTGTPSGTAPATTCGALNSAANSTTTANTTSTGIWSPIVITVPTGQDLTITLTDNLTFATGTGTNNVPTSLVVVGQLGGGLGPRTVSCDPTSTATTGATCTASPDHTNAQPSTWPIAADGPGKPVVGVGTPPLQGPRVQSFASEATVGAPANLCWGVCGVGGPALKPGTYLIQSGTHPSIQGPMGLYGVLVVTTAPGATAGTAYGVVGSTTAVTYGADVALLMSEIDPVQNVAVNLAVTTAGFAETNVWSGLYGGCGNPRNANGSLNSGTTASLTPYGSCYPPAVNYTPLYYLINGRGFDKTNPPASMYSTNPASGFTAPVLVRLVNAGLRMHVPSIVGAQTGADASAVPPIPASSGFSLIAEDANVLPGVPRVQSEVFMAAGKTYDVKIDPPAGTAAVPIYDRELSLSGNSVARDAGMLAYIGANSATGTPAAATASAQPDNYTLLAGRTLVVSDPGKGVLANDINVSGVQLTGGTAACNATASNTPCVTLNADGTFVFVPGTATSGSFTYCGNGGAACTTVTLAACGTGCLEAGTGIVMNSTSYNVNGTFVKIQPPGILSVDSDGAGHPLTVALTGTNAPAPSAGLTLRVDANGGFSASIASCTPAAGATTCPATFTYHAQNSQGVVSSATATVQINFAPATGLQVRVIDGIDKTTVLGDYRWVIEEDRTFYVDPKCSTNPPPAGCPTASSGIVPTFGTNFHTSYMPVVATGCTGRLSCEGGQTMFDPASGMHVNAVCDLGNGVCRPDTTGNGFTPSMPSSVHLDPTKRYYISVLPGDAANPFIDGNLTADCAKGQVNNPDQNLPPDTRMRCGHGMGGAPVLCKVAAGATACSFQTTTAAPLTILTQPAPYPPAKLSVFVFEDDFPLNGEHDAGGGVDVLSPNEPGLGGFNITLFDDAGGTGDATGQMTYDMFNQPLVNSLAGTIDPATNQDACPISVISRIGSDPNLGPGSYDKTQTGITGTIVTCPKFEADGTTLSPLAGQAVIANLMVGRYGVVATPGADRIGRGEEWLQTNTLDGQKAHDSFLRVGEPSFFQEYGPAGYHVSIGFANPAIINARKQYVCNHTDPNINGTNCNNTLTGQVTTERMSRTPDERLYSSGDYSSFSFTQCYVSFGDADGEDFAFTKCNPDGTFTLSGLPDGDWRITVFDQWNDMLVDGLSTPVRLSGGTTFNIGDIAMNQWQANIYTNSFFDADGNGVLARDSSGNPTEGGLALVSTNIRFRDGSYSNFNNTDLSGAAGFNEVFPLFSWYVIETDSTRYANTGTHVVYDAGGPADGTPCGNAVTPRPTAPCGNSVIAGNMANTVETVSVPVALRVPGAVYCATADCTGKGLPGNTAGGSSTSDPPSACTISPSDGTTSCTTTLSTGRIDPPWVTSEGWQGFSGQNSFIEFGKRPFGDTENGGIHGEVIYASTRPFDDPQLLLHTSWTPDVPNVRVNLYQVGTSTADGTQTLTLVDTTTTSSWDDWAQGFYPNTNKPYMNCPGQLPAPTMTPPAAGDLFFFTLFNQPMWLDMYENGGAASHTIPNNSQFKCYDGMHNWNQVQPAPYDGMYRFPSITGRDPTTGKPTGGTNPTVVGTNCTVCVANPVTLEPMLPAGQYVVEMVTPPGYELVKEEDKNILIGDNYIAPVTQEFPGLGGTIYILPDQANVSSVYNANQGLISGFNPVNAQNPTQALGRISSLPSYEGDTGSIEAFWPCVGQSRIVPDYISLFPGSLEVSPFAGARRNLCDRKLVTLNNQSSVLTKFWIFTSTHVAAHFTGVITDDFTSEFDPFSPQFGEKFSPASLPVAIKDWQGNEISRVYSDWWGSYDGLTYSTWEVNPPNPTGYGPTMMVTCMNDPGNAASPDPLYNPAYSDFCYEIPFMPGQTQYMDTPVVPTSAFAGAGYNNPDCDYPDATPAVSEVDVDGNLGPWAASSGVTHTLHIFALGTVAVNNYAYSGPASTAAPFNQKTVTRHYSFGPTAGTVSLVSQANPTTGATTTLTLSGAAITSWSDTQINVTVAALPGAFNCLMGQQGASNTKCAQVVVTSANGKQSVDAVTVTLGGNTPTHVTATGAATAATNACTATSYGSIQRAIDCARPGDLIIIDPRTRATAAAAAVPAVHEELVLMWKPVRLQGVAAASSIINANTHPAGKLDAWRRQVNCLFGMAINGQPPSALNPFDDQGIYSCPTAPGTGTSRTATANFNGTPVTLAYWSARSIQTASTQTVDPQVDRLPLEAIVGWDASQNGNMAELLQEPGLMGALEGAGVTVLSKGVRFPPGTTDPLGSIPTAAGEEGTYPTGTVLLTSGTSSTTGCGGNLTANPHTSNFYCNPSSIDGLTITNSSQGGGGIFVHGWGHNLQIANNRVTNNAGTLSGGINVGQGEFPNPYTVGGTNGDPGTCQGGLGSLPAGAQEQYCFDVNVNMHNNMVTKNSSIGDELFSATPAGAGGVSICNGSDFYKFNYNWVCGNLSTGDGGGIAHVGFSYNGDIEHNSILFNQSTNPTIATNGGGILIMGAPDQDPACGTQTDQDCLNNGSTTQPIVAPSDGVGPNLVINANLIMGNGAESGSGGGLRLQGINGSDVLQFPQTPCRTNGSGQCISDNWYHVTVTNNIIANNVAGWDGAGISLQDALYVDIVNNTIVSNDTTASSGVLFNTLGAPLASSQGPCPGGRSPDGSCPSANGPTSSTPQPSGLVSIQNSVNLTSNLPTTVVCPPNHFSGPATAATNGSCRTVSFPVLYNNIFWENRAFTISVGALGLPSAINQQNVVSLFPTLTQPVGDLTAPNGNGQLITGGTGACVTEPAFSATGGYWDIGVRGDTGPADHSSTVTLAPFYSVLTDTTGYSAASLHNIAANPNVISQYCNGARVPPENGGLGYNVPPGIADATVPNPIFSLTPAATVDEGNNWINIAWGPLSLVNTSNGTLNGTTLGDYGLTSSSTSAIDRIPSTAGVFYTAAPGGDFYNHLRKVTGNTAVDAGAVEYGATSTPGGVALSVTGGPLAFGSVVTGQTSAAQILTVSNTGTAPTTSGVTVSITSPFSRPAGTAGGTCATATTLLAGASCTINVVFAPTAVGVANGTATITSSSAVADSPVALSGVGAAQGIAAALNPNNATITSSLGCDQTNCAVQGFTLTNTGNVTLTGIAVQALSGTDAAKFNFVPLLSTCAGVAGEAAPLTSLAPGASCVVTVRYQPLATDSQATRHATLTINSAAPAQTAAITGKVN